MKVSVTNTDKSSMTAEARGKRVGCPWQHRVGIVNWNISERCVNISVGFIDYDKIIWPYIREE